MKTMFDEMRTAIENAPRNAYVAEFHTQVLKHAHRLESVSGRELCEGLGLKPSWGVEFSKMKKLAPRLRAAGMDPAKL
jgi:hypothetical protein